MWCPKGYATFREIQGSLERILYSKQAIEKIHEELRWQSLGDPESEEFILGSVTELRDLSIKERHERFVTVQDWVKAQCIHEFFRNCPSLSVTSPNGVCLRIDHRAMAFRLIPGLGRQFTFVDAGTGTISSSHFNRCYEIAKTASDEMRSRIDEIDRNADEYNHYWTVCEVLDDFEHWKVLQQFDNWAIGCELADLPVDAAELMSLDFRFAKVNRTEVVSDLTDEIIRAFDDGLIRSKHILWKDGFPYEKREAFRAAWSAASIQRPNLSKHGPKTLK